MGEKTPDPFSCPHGPRCVPCPLRGFTYREQLARKRSTLQSALARYPWSSDLEVDDVIGSRDLFGYRNAVKLAIRARRDGSLRAGVYAPGSHRLVDAERCSAQHPALTEVVAAVLEEAKALAIAAYDEQGGTGELRYIVARYSAWLRQVRLVLVSGTRDMTRLRELARRVARRCRSLGGVLHNFNADPGNVILGKHWGTLRPPALLVDRIGFLKMQTSPGAFLQANLWTARRIYETVVEWAAPQASETVVDLFCGVGPLSLYLATQARHVVGVEESPPAVIDARANQRRNGFHNVRFEEGMAADVLPRLRERLARAELVTLNPTRKGASSGLLEEIAAFDPKRIVYVSCEPETLARDLDRLHSLGYRPTRLRPFDMLPQTEHVEVVALAERMV